MICSQTSLEKKLIHVQHIKIGALSTFLILAMVMLTAVDLSQGSVLAQNSTSTLGSTPITSAPETSSGDDEETASSDDSEESASTDDSEESASSDVQEDATSEEDIDETEDAYAQTNPLREQIRERVMGATSDLTGSDDSDEQNIPLNGVGDSTENTEQTIPLLDQITNNVTGTLSSNGLG